MDENKNPQYLNGYRTFFASPDQMDFSFREEIIPKEYHGDIKYIQLDYKTELHKLNTKALKAFQNMLNTFKKDSNSITSAKEDEDPHQQKRHQLMQEIKGAFENTLEILSAYRQEEARFTVMERIKEQINQKQTLINQLEKTTKECEIRLKEAENLLEKSTSS